jgi:hypothetical protein
MYRIVCHKSINECLCLAGVMDPPTGLSHTHHRLAVIYRRRPFSDIPGRAHVHVDVTNQIRAAQRCGYLRMSNKHITQNEPFGSAQRSG